MFVVSIAIYRTYLSVCLSNLSTCLSVCLSVCLFVCLFIYPSVAMESKLIYLENRINQNLGCSGTDSPQATATSHNTKAPNILTQRVVDEYKRHK